MRKRDRGKRDKNGQKSNEKGRQENNDFQRSALQSKNSITLTTYATNHCFMAQPESGAEKKTKKLMKMALQEAKTRKKKKEERKK